MKKLFSTILVLGLLFSNPSSAGGISVKIYLKAMSQNDEKLTSLIEGNIMAISDGLMYANVELKSSGQEQVYCQPPNLALNTKALIGFLEVEIDDYTERGIDVSEVPIGMLLIKSLKRNFPCN